MYKNEYTFIDTNKNIYLITYYDMKINIYNHNKPSSPKLIATYYQTEIRFHRPDKLNSTLYTIWELNSHLDKDKLFKLLKEQL